MNIDNELIATLQAKLAAETRRADEAKVLADIELRRRKAVQRAARKLSLLLDLDKIDSNKLRKERDAAIAELADAKKVNRMYAAKAVQVNTDARSLAQVLEIAKQANDAREKAEAERDEIILHSKRVIRERDAALEDFESGRKAMIRTVNEESDRRDKAESERDAAIKALAESEKARVQAEADAAAAIDLLRMGVDVVKNHNNWCGFDGQSPGYSNLPVFLRDANEILSSAHHCQQLLDRLEAQRKALEFYAKSENYRQDYSFTTDFDGRRILTDGGARARVTLNSQPVSVQDSGREAMNKALEEAKAALENASSYFIPNPIIRNKVGAALAAIDKALKGGE